MEATWLVTDQLNLTEWTKCFTSSVLRNSRSLFERPISFYVSGGLEYIVVLTLGSTQGRLGVEPFGRYLLSFDVDLEASSKVERKDGK
jgi:hypothetical protein